MLPLNAVQMKLLFAFPPAPEQFMQVQRAASTPPRGLFAFDHFSSKPNNTYEDMRMFCFRRALP